MTKRSTVLLADDHSLLRGTLECRLTQEPDLQVVASVGDASQAVTEALRLAPDVVVMDIDMPGQSSFDAARTIKSRLPATRIVFLSAFHHDRYIEQAIAMEAAGYLTKTEPPEKLIDSIRRVLAGGTAYSPEVQARIVITGPGEPGLASARTRMSTLTEREVTVLQHIARGLSKKEVAVLLHVTPAAVDRHCTRLMTKLDIHDRVELTRFAIREGLAEA